MGGFEQIVVGCLAVDGIDHHLSRLDVFYRLKPRKNILVARVVDIVTTRSALEKHGLNNHMTVECLQTLNDFTDVVGTGGAVHLINICRIDGIELLNVVVHSHECVVDSLAMGESRVAQHRHFGIGEILVAQPQSVVHDFREMRMAGGLAIACKGKDVGRRTILLHVAQLVFESLSHLLTCWQFLLGPVVGIETAFAVNTVEGAGLSVTGQQVDAQRHTQPATMHRTENGRRIDDCAHGCKSSKKSGVKRLRPRVFFMDIVKKVKRRKKGQKLFPYNANFSVFLQQIWCNIPILQMGKKRKKTGSHRGLQVITLCISTSMVLILLGMVVFSVLSARNLSAYVKENLTLTMILGEDMTTPEARILCKDLVKKPYINHLNFISKEEALQEQSREMGTDPSEFAGFNPFLGSIEVQLKADYANSDSINWISKQLRKYPKVADLTYPQVLMDSVNSNLKKINMVLLVLAVLLTFVSFSLINNTVRLGVYARRFSIHTMKLVGASWGFIRKPFVRNAVLTGILASIIAIAVLAGGIYLLYTYEPEVLTVITWEVLAITAGSVLLFGIIITTLCSYFSVNRFLKMKASELYKI